MNPDQKKSFYYASLAHNPQAIVENLNSSFRIHKPGSISYSQEMIDEVTKLVTRDKFNGIRLDGTAPMKSVVDQIFDQTSQGEKYAVINIDKPDVAELIFIIAQEAYKTKTPYMTFMTSLDTLIGHAMLLEHDIPYDSYRTSLTVSGTSFLTNTLTLTINFSPIPKNITV